mmetsp:Transcript_38486/g.82951  ORF Transcript_38486/g.82951 Transcript_38486/m.82951 type:complete len:109 (+) Transcript_38486:98-424(+)
MTSEDMVCVYPSNLRLITRLNLQSGLFRSVLFIMCIFICIKMPKRMRGKSENSYLLIQEDIKFEKNSWNCHMDVTIKAFHSLITLFLSTCQKKKITEFGQRFLMKPQR